MRGSGCYFAMQGERGQRGDVDFEWITEVNNPMPPSFREPEVLKNEYASGAVSPKAYELVVRQSNNPDELDDFKNKETLDNFIEKHGNFSTYLEFLWVFVQSRTFPNWGTLLVQSVFMSRAATTKSRHLATTLTITGISIVSFVITIPVCLFADAEPCAILVPFISYFLGWITFVYSLRVILEFVPPVRRFETLLPRWLGVRL